MFLEMGQSLVRNNGTFCNIDEIPWGSQQQTLPPEKQVACQAISPGSITTELLSITDI